MLPPIYTKTCALDGCDVEFQTDNPRKKHCSPAHSVTSRMRRLRAKRRRGGGGGGGNGGGGGIPSLFDTITPVDPRALTINPLPVIGPSERKPVESTRPENSPVPASEKACKAAA